MGSPSPPRTTHVRLGHVCIEVTDLARSALFYDRFLGRVGFHRFVKESSYAGYSNGELSVWLVQESPARVRRHPVSGEEEVVADHLAFLVSSAADVLAVQTDLERLEVYPTFRCGEHPEFRPGYTSATWVDPDHAVLEVYYVPTPTPRTRRRRRPRGSKVSRPTGRRRTATRRRAA